MNFTLRMVSGSLLALFLTSGILASDHQTCLLFSITQQHVARLGVVNTDKGNAKLEIINSSDEVVFTKNIPGKHNYFQLLDLSKMPDGNYKVKLSGEEKTYVKEFVVNNQVATVKVKHKEVEVAPVFHMINNDELAVTYLNTLGKNVSIYFELSDEVIFEDRNLTQTPITKKYSLKKLPKGNYTVKLYAGNNIFSYSMALK